MVSAETVAPRSEPILTPCAGLTEEQITEIFSGAGRVMNFRLVYDRETGRPKGFGFAEFPDYGTVPCSYSSNRKIQQLLTSLFGLRLRGFCSQESERPRNHGSQAAGRFQQRDGQR